ncbi:MAG: porin family protein [Campylobacteraceae bacterium]|jgi:opacity protein-like surface antigen|nr:porin family protein [Campylobacteraceae bacterium]
MKKIALAVVASSVLAFAASSEITIVGGEAKPLNLNEYDKHITYGVRFGIGLEDALGVDNPFVSHVEIGYDYSREVEYTRKQSNFKGESSLYRLYANAIREFDLTDSIKFYALAGVGYEEFARKVPKRYFVFGQYGAGAKYYFTDYLALKVEVRHGIEIESPNRDNLFYTLGLTYTFAGKNQKEPALQLR